MADILTVTSLNLYVKSLLENDRNLFDIAVEGEVSNFKKYPSGHCYFTLKDEKSSIKAVMFQSYARGLGFNPENGMKVIARGKVSLYERDGAYQLYVTNMFMSGAGAYQLAFDRLKEKLAREGLFDQSKKKRLPLFPFKIGVATSAKGAALHDIVSTAQRRFPAAEIVLAPCMVQGSEAEPTIINAIRQLDAVDDIEVIIIARGGGSKEDLWVFNSEAVARAAFACKKPTVSAIGHEIDFSILDFVCDVRAATPTQAAEIVFPDVYSLRMQLSEFEKNISRSIKNRVKNLENELVLVEKSDGFIKARNIVDINAEYLKRIQSDLKKSMERRFEKLSQDINIKTQLIDERSPINNLKKGYALLYKGETAVKHTDFTVGESLKVVTYNQEIDCEITKVAKRKI
ncbi:MAG: exodeoxyribonuclease VII large subunit [Oscillospiraceae bacterium]|nr:exodeoxyribonuclease VII large subunit [Oscillospiraceae bacterium]